MHVIGVHFLRICGAAWNTGTCLYMFWTGLGCLMQCINSIVWNGNMINRAPVYCDICKSLDALLSSVRSPFVIPQQPVFKLRSMLHSRLVRFASIAASTRLQQ
jgi:Pheromone A receptor